VVFLPLVATPLFHIALLRPKIPQNTGNIGRLTLALGGRLHLVGPLGFRTDDRALRRAGLDYWPHLDWRRHADLAELERALGPDAQIFAFTTRAARSYTEASYRPGDCLLFGDEVSGLPQEVVDRAGARAVRIPLRGPQVRSLNLANAAAIAASELVRQLGHPDAVAPRPAAAPEVPCRST